MDYHQDRFDDFSLLVFKNEILIAVLPANRKEDKVFSHQGLTYGSLIFSRNIKFQDVLQGFKTLLKHLYSHKVSVLELKMIPTIYSSFPSDEINYIMFLLNAKLMRRDTLSVINLKEEIKISNNRAEGYKRAKKHKLQVREADDFEEFWNEILIPNLKSKHKVSPVHTLDEIQSLKKKFPEQIRQFNVYERDKIVAGTTIFETKRVAHSQYIAANSNKNTLGSLDFLHYYLINTVFANKHYFDFGSSNENQGRQINKGLQFWKEGFGARTVTQDFYNIETKNYIELNNVML